MKWITATRWLAAHHGNPKMRVQADVRIPRRHGVTEKRSALLDGRDDAGGGHNELGRARAVPVGRGQIARKSRIVVGARWLAVRINR
jgi:hypothetical protein